jgi:cupin superfamily acireductone dioxygenase involved in methionine salvage
MKITIEHYDIKTSWEASDEQTLDDVRDAIDRLLGIIGYQTDDSINDEDDD